MSLSRTLRSSEAQRANRHSEEAGRRDSSSSKRRTGFPRELLPALNGMAPVAWVPTRPWRCSTSVTYPQVAAGAPMVFSRAATASNDHREHASEGGLPTGPHLGRCWSQPENHPRPSLRCERPQRTPTAGAPGAPSRPRRRRTGTRSAAWGSPRCALGLGERHHERPSTDRPRTRCRPRSPGR